MNEQDLPSKLEEIQSQKEWFRVILSSIGDAVIATDTAGNILLLNPVAESLTGWPEREAVGKPLDEVFTVISEARQPVENPVTKALREDTAVELANHTLLVRKDGEELSIADSAAPIRDAVGNTIGVVLIFRDVTEERRAEIALNDAKEYAENIVDTIRHPLLILDSDLRVQTANRSFYRHFHVAPQDTEHRLVYELGNGQWDIPQLRQLLTDILPQNTSFDDYEVEHDFPNIGHRFMKLNARRMYREGNHTELILLAIEDVTNQKRSENERREIETRFTSLVKNIKDHSIFTLDPEGHITSWNREAENILGFSEEEVAGRHFSIIFTEEDQRNGIPQQELDTAKDAGQAEDERWHRRKNGELFWALGIVTPTADAEGNHTGFSKILRDMTERKKSQEALQKHSQHLRMLWDSGEALLTASDPPAMLNAMFNRVSEHLEVDAYFNFVVDESEQVLRMVSCGGIPESTARAIEQLKFGEAVCGNVALQHKSIVATYIQESNDPKIEFVKRCGIRSYACNPLLFEDRLIGTLSFASRRRDEFDEEELGFFQTISQYVTVAFVRLQLVEQLREAHRRKDEFLAMLAHELRNPLAPIRSGLDILALEEGPHHDTIQLMQAQMRHVVRLVDDLMDVSRIMRGKVELRKQQVELAAIVQQSVAAVRPAMDSQQQELIVNLPHENILLDADPIRVVQVLENLLTNASKYTQTGGRIELVVGHRESLAIIRVIDNGLGIAPELLPNVFELFTQSTRTLDRSQGGLGIGLTLVKSLVDLHGGTVSAASEGLGHGSTFTVELPISLGMHPIEEQSPPQANSAAWRILVVDDNQGATYLLSRLLQKLGRHEVETAPDGPSALAKVQEFQPDIVLLDIGLPGIDGYEVAKTIRATSERERVLLVALTGYGQAEDHRKSQEAGFDEHLVKPPSVEQIKTVLGHPKLSSPAMRKTSIFRNRQEPKPNKPQSTSNSKTVSPPRDGRSVFPPLTAERVQHDLRNTFHMFSLVDQLLATRALDTDMIETAREGLRAEMNRLQELTEALGQHSEKNQ